MPRRLHAYELQRRNHRTCQSVRSFNAHGARRWAAAISLAVLFVSLARTPLYAQDPPPRIGPWVVDVHGVMPKFNESCGEIDLNVSVTGRSVEGMLAPVRGSTVGPGGSECDRPINPSPPSPTVRPSIFGR